MSATTYAWLVLAFPLAGSILIGLTWRWLPGRTAGVIGTSAIALAFLCAIGALVQLQAEPAEARHLAGRELADRRAELLDEEPLQLAPAAARDRAVERPEAERGPVQLAVALGLVDADGEAAHASPSSSAASRALSRGLV